MKRRIEKQAIGHMQDYTNAWGKELEAQKNVGISEYMAASGVDKKLGYMAVGVQTTGSETELADRKAELATATGHLEDVLSQSEKFAADNQAALHDLAVKDAERNGVHIVK